jgi:hypothetical protein
MMDEIANSKVNKSYGGRFKELMGTVLGPHARNRDNGLRLWQANLRL